MYMSIFVPISEMVCFSALTSLVLSIARPIPWSGSTEPLTMTPESSLTVSLPSGRPPSQILRVRLPRLILTMALSVLLVSLLNTTPSRLQSSQPVLSRARQLSPLTAIVTLSLLASPATRFTPAQSRNSPSFASPRATRSEFFHLSSARNTLASRHSNEPLFYSAPDHQSILGSQDLAALPRSRSSRSRYAEQISLTPWYAMRWQFRALADAHSNEPRHTQAFLASDHQSMLATHDFVAVSNSHSSFERWQQKRLGSRSLALGPSTLHCIHPKLLAQAYYGETTQHVWCRSSSPQKYTQMTAVRVSCSPSRSSCLAIAVAVVQHSQSLGQPRQHSMTAVRVSCSPSRSSSLAIAVAVVQHSQPLGQPRQHSLPFPSLTIAPAAVELAPVASAILPAPLRRSARSR
jgi:hypothetical protein